MAVINYSALDAAGRRAFNRALDKGMAFDVHGRLLDRNRKQRTIIKTINDGAVNIDTSTEAGMWADIDVADEDNKLKLDDHLLFLKRILQLIWQITVPELGKVAVEGFTGPCNKVDKLPGGALAIEAQSMEFWLRGGIQYPMTWPKGTRTTDIMRRIAIVAGTPAKYIDIPDRNATIPAPFQLVPLTGVDDDPDAFQSYLEAERYLASSLEADFLATRAGYLTFISWNAANEYEFHGDQTVIDPPQATTQLGGMGGQAGDAAQIVNHVIVIGRAKPKTPPKGSTGGKTPPAPVIKGEWRAPKGSKYSVGNLGNPHGQDAQGRPTGGMLLTEVYTNEQIHTNSNAQHVADMRGRRYLQTGLQVGFTTIPTPHVERYGRVQLHTKEGLGNGDYDFLVSSLPIKWSPTNPQTVGFRRKVWVPMQRHRQ